MMDRISWLPDPLLVEIISRIKIMDKETAEERFMSTKEVIQTTTTISKRWQHLWTRLPTLVFLHEDVRGNDDDLTNYFSFISQTLSQCPTDVNLDKFKLQFKYVYQPMDVQLNSWIRYAITRNVQEIDSTITRTSQYKSYDDHLFFNNSCLVSLELSSCVFNPPNNCAAIRWDKLKFLRIHQGKLDDEDLIGNMLSGSPCLETFELNDCHLHPRVPKSLFQNFGLVLERLSCHFKTYQSFRNHDDLLFDDTPSPVRMTFARPPPPNAAIPFLQLKFLHIEGGYSYNPEDLNEVSIREILSGNPFLETFELEYFSLTGRIPKTLFGNFGALERFECGLKTYQRISSKDELFLDNADSVCMKLSRPPNGAISSDKLMFLCIDFGKLDEDSIGNMLSGSPFLETLHLSSCYGCRRINVTSKSLKNLVISGYGCEDPKADYYIDTVVINAPHILRLTIEDTMHLEELLLENVSSLATAYLGFEGSEDLGLDPRDLEENLLLGLLSSLGHVNEIALETKFPSRCISALTRLEAKGFQFRKGSFRRGVSSDSYQVYSLNQK